MEIVSPIMAYDMTELWRDAVKSKYRSVGDTYLFEANASGRSANVEPSLYIIQLMQFFTMLNSLINYRKAVACTSI